MPNSNAEPDLLSDEQMVQEIVRHQRSVYRLLLSLVGHYGDAEDLTQQTMITVWQKRAEYPTDNSLAWVFSIAKNHARNHLRKSARRGTLNGLSETSLEHVAAAHERLGRQRNARQEALDGCVQKLPVTQRELVEQHYARELSIEQLASKVEKSVDAVYKSLQRIRRTLFDCVNRQVSST